MSSPRMFILPWCALVALCTSCSGCKDDVASSEGVPLSSVSPPQAWLGRRVELRIVGAGTHFAGTPIVKFNDPEIKTTRVDVLSPTSLRATVEVGEAAAAGPHDVIVTTPGQGDIPEESASLRGGLVVAATLKHQLAGSAPQGGLVDFDVANLDKDNPFTGPAPALVSGGVIVRYTEVSAERVAGTALVDARAPTGPLRMRMAARNPRGELVDFVSSANDPMAPSVTEARSPYALEPGKAEPNEAIATPRQSNLYRAAIPSEDQVFMLQFGTVGAALRTISGARLTGSVAPESGKFGEGRFFDTTYDNVAGARVAVGLIRAAGAAYFAVHASDLSGGPNEYNYSLKLSLAKPTKFSMKEPPTPDGPTAPLTAIDVNGPTYATDGAIDAPEDADYLLFTAKKAGRVFVQVSPIGASGPLNVTIYGDDPGTTFCSSFMAGGLGTNQAEFRARADNTYCLRVNSTSRLTMPYELVVTPEL